MPLTSDDPIRILIVDDHPIVLEGLKSLIATEPGMVTVGVACNGAEAYDQCQRLQPDIVLLDLRLPDVRGTELIAAIRNSQPMAHVLIVSSFAGDADIRACLQAGASGYLIKDAPPEELFAAIRAAVHGASFLSHSAAAKMVDCARFERLTPREQEILELIADGQSNHDIARIHGLTVATVKTYVHHILRKLNAASRSAAIAAAVKRGLVRTRG